MAAGPPSVAAVLHGQSVPDVNRGAALVLERALVSGAEWPPTHADEVSGLCLCQRRPRPAWPAATRPSS